MICELNYCKGMTKLNDKTVRLHVVTQILSLRIHVCLGWEFGTVHKPTYDPS